MGGGGGKGGTVSAKPDKNVSQFVGEVRESTRPIRDEIFNQIFTAIKTGGVGPQLPIVAQSEQASRQATSQAMDAITGNLARAGLGRTPYGQRVLADTLLQGEQNVAAARLAPIQKAFELAPNIALGSAGQVISGLTSASGIGMQGAQIAAQRDIAKGNQQTSFLSSLMSVGGLLGAASIVT